jgi:hypothetical protein
LFSLTGMKFISTDFRGERPLQVRKFAAKKLFSVNCQKCGMEYLSDGYDAPRGSGAIFHFGLPFSTVHLGSYCGPAEVYRDVQTARFLNTSSPLDDITGFHHAVGFV